MAEGRGGGEYGRRSPPPVYGGPGVLPPGDIFEFCIVVYEV